MSDKYKILQYLHEHGSITTWEAIQKFGCTRLSGRIYDLRTQDQIPIVTTMIEVIDRDGVKTRVARYSIKEESNG